MTNQISEEKLNKADGGFSLIEVIIAIVILALVTIPLLSYFTDSLQHSVRMARQQRATLAAQEVTESLKAVDRLIEKSVDETGQTVYSVPYLELLLDDCRLEEGGYNTDGTGSATYSGVLTKDSESFDVKVQISTGTSANAVERPLIYGIDDAKDVMILERDQKEEALTYFTSVNVNYCSEHPDQTMLSQNQILGGMTRTINILVDNIKEDSTDDDSVYFTVKAYYDYKCVGLRGTGSSDTYTCTYLVNSKVSALENIYLLYNFMAGDDRIKLDVKMPSFTTEDGTTYVTTELGLYLIAQNYEPDSSDVLYLDGFDGVWMSVYTNVEKVEDGLGTVTTNSLTATGNPIRLIEIKTEVYKKGHEETDDALIVVETTKGE